MSARIDFLPAIVSALTFALCTALFAQDKPATTTAATPAPATPAASAGLVNDWLRKESASFSPWDLGGQVRSRYEVREHFAIPGQPGAIDFRRHGADTENDYLLLREKIHLGYTPCSWFTIFAEGRNSDSYNDDRVPEPEEDQYDLQQAYLLLGNKNEFPLSLKLGRQELSYGDERMIGAFDWNNIGRVFDAAKLRYENKQLWVDGFVGRVVIPVDNEFNEPNDYDYFSGVYASTRTLIPKQETQLYFLARNVGADSPTSQSGALVPLATPRDVYTFGLRVKSLPGQFGGWDYSAELMYQFGRFKETATNITSVAGQSLDQEAFAAFVGGGYTWTEAKGTPRLGLEYNYGSGDDNPADGKHGTFDNLFPTNHRFYGYMDFVSLQNIHNLRLMSSIKPCKKVTLSLDGQFFWLANTEDNFYTVGGTRRGGTGPTSGNGYGINPGYSSYVGSELDLIVTYNIKPYAVAQAGYGHFFVGDYVESSLSSPKYGSKDADFFYLQMVFNF